ncbi:hypothetical protein ACS0TY_015432 [Phlomoides rotata]
MELCLLHHPLKPTFFHHSLSSLPTTGKRRSYRLGCRCSSSSPEGSAQKLYLLNEGRRAFMGCLLAAAAGVSFKEEASAVSTSRRALRGAKIPESEYTTLPNGLKYYDLKVGGGLKAVKGSRVAIHYVAKWKGITFMTSRQGLGVVGGTPYGFDVGQSERGAVLKGLDLGVEGMRVGGQVRSVPYETQFKQFFDENQALLIWEFNYYNVFAFYILSNQIMQRLLIVPPELAYGSKGVQEIPPNAIIEMDVELISIKQNPFGSAVKLIEG